MSLLIRPLEPDEARYFLEVRSAAVRSTAAADYSSDVIEAWAPLPISPARVEEVRANPGNEIRVAAVSQGEIVGIGVVIPWEQELRACYVSPRSGRMGVGRAIVEELERIAQAHGAPGLSLVSSITAEKFYKSLGYEAIEKSEHILSSGARMACVRMRKQFQPSPMPDIL